MPDFKPRRAALIAACAIFIFAPLPAPALDCSNLLLHIRSDGQVARGSKQDVVAAAIAGKRLRLGWQLGPKEHTLIHWAEPTFLSVFHGNVFAQLPAIHVQRGVAASRTIELFGDSAEQWFGMLSTDGRVSGRHGAQGRIESFPVEQVWCLLP